MLLNTFRRNGRPASVGEDETSRAGAELGDMRGESVGDNLGERDGAVTGITLDRTEHRRIAVGPDELAVYPDLSTEEVDAVDGETEALALPIPIPAANTTSVA